MFEHFSMDLDVFLIKSYWISDFVTIEIRFCYHGNQIFHSLWEIRYFLIVTVKIRVPTSFIVEVIIIFVRYLR